MESLKRETEQPVLYELPPGAAHDDALQTEYARPLADAAAEIAEQLKTLLAEIGLPGFDASTRLDATLNGADVLIYGFFEVVGGYAQGRRGICKRKNLQTILCASPRNVIQCAHGWGN